MKRIMLVYEDEKFEKLKKEKDKENWKNWEDFVFGLLTAKRRLN